VKALQTAASTTFLCLMTLGLFATGAGPAGAETRPEASAAPGSATAVPKTGTVRRATASTVRLSPARTAHGRQITLRGRVDSRSSVVRILFRPSGARRWYPVKNAATDANGRYQAVVQARANGQYRAVVPGGRSSEPKNVLVRSRIKVAPVRKYAKLGSRVLIRGSVSPAGGRRVKVVIRGSVTRVLSTRTRAHGGFKISWKPNSSGSYRIRVFAASNGRAISDSSRQIRISGLRPTHASYFGPGLFGGPMACGGTLQPGTRGVAHKTLPCGTKVVLRYRGRTVTTRVVDRGPYVGGREFDLTQATRDDLGFGDLGTVWTNR
jgi:rare lipoprotein A